MEDAQAGGTAQGFALIHHARAIEWPPGSASFTTLTLTKTCFTPSQILIRTILKVIASIFSSSILRISVAFHKQHFSHFPACPCTTSRAFTHLTWTGRTENHSSAQLPDAKTFQDQSIQGYHFVHPPHFPEEKMETLADKVSLYQTFGIFLELSPVAY
jgi:hypothetical protein